jgi:hypothetical protein
MDRLHPVGCQGHTPAGSPPWVHRCCSGRLTPSAPSSHGVPNASGCSHRIVGRPAELAWCAPMSVCTTPGRRAVDPTRPSRVTGAGVLAADAVRSRRACRTLARLVCCPLPTRLASLARAIVWQGPSQRRCAPRRFPSRKHNACIGHARPMRQGSISLGAPAPGARPRRAVRPAAAAAPDWGLHGPAEG